MRFELLPVTDRMLDLYRLPRTPARFDAYLALLQGPTRGDLTLPVGGFNPMAKEPAVAQLQQLQALGAETLLAEALAVLNAALPDDGSHFRVALNLCDDAAGGWTNRFTTDYNSKFRTKGLHARHFCVPVFWTSETVDAQTVRTRTLEYCCRALYQHKTAKLPETLAEHIAQEAAVAKRLHLRPDDRINLAPLQQFFDAHRATTDYGLLFNFLYGDAAAESLGLRPLGIREAFAGYAFARFTAGV